MFSCCFPAGGPGGVTEVRALARGTLFTANEVEALWALFSSVSNTVVEDNQVHREEFRLALFGSKEPSLWADRIFDQFDAAHNDVVDFKEFVRALAVFHPAAPAREKAAFAFRLYDLGGTGSIEQNEVRTLLQQLFKSNKDLKLSDDSIEKIIARTFAEADTTHDGKISKEEWWALVQNHPLCIKNMTLPALCGLTERYPSLMFNSTAEKSTYRLTAAPALKGPSGGAKREAQRAAMKTEDDRWGDPYA